MEKTSPDNKVALVTGSSRGIGAAIARLFAQNGALFVLHGRDSKALNQVQEQLKANPAKVMQVKANITKFSEIENMRMQIEKTFGPVDILVANAGKNLVR